MSKLICARCKTEDRPFPFTLYGENGKIIHYRKTKFPEFRNKVVCYNCWEVLVYGREENEYQVKESESQTENKTENSKSIIKWNEDGSMKSFELESKYDILVEELVN